MRIAENEITAHYDKKASQHLQRAAENARQADKMKDPKQREKYWKVAQDHLRKANDALEAAKAASEKQMKKVDFIKPDPASR